MLSWTYVTPSLVNLMKKIKLRDSGDTILSDATAYKQFNTNLYSVSRDYLSTLDTKYLMVDEVN